MNKTKLTKEELQAKLDSLEKQNSVLKKVIVKINNRKKPSNSKRKKEVLNLLKQKPISIYDMSRSLDITNKNISSQLCYLKKDGYKIATNSDGLKFIEDYDY